MYFKIKLLFSKLCSSICNACASYCLQDLYRLQNRIKNAPEAYSAVVNDEKRILILTFWNTLRNTVLIQNVCLGFWDADFLRFYGNKRKKVTF